VHTILQTRDWKLNKWQLCNTKQPKAKKFGTHIPVNIFRSLKTWNFYSKNGLPSHIPSLRVGNTNRHNVREARRISYCKTELPSPATGTTDKIVTDPQLYRVFFSPPAWTISAGPKHRQMFRPRCVVGRFSGRFNNRWQVLDKRSQW